MRADEAVLVLVLGFPLVLGVTSLVRHGTSSIGGALTIASAIALAVGLGAVGVIGSLDDYALVSKIHALPVAASALSLGAAAVPLLRGKGHSLSATLAKAALAALPVLAVVVIAQQFLTCLCA